MSRFGFIILLGAVLSPAVARTAEPLASTEREDTTDDVNGVLGVAFLDGGTPAHGSAVLTQATRVRALRMDDLSTNTLLTVRPSLWFRYVRLSVRATVGLSWKLGLPTTFTSDPALAASVPLALRRFGLFGAAGASATAPISLESRARGEVTSMSAFAWGFWRTPLRGLTIGGSTAITYSIHRKDDGADAFPLCGLASDFTTTICIAPALPTSAVSIRAFARYTYSRFVIGGTLVNHTFFSEERRLNTSTNETSTSSHFTDQPVLSATVGIGILRWLSASASILVFPAPRWRPRNEFSRLIEGDQVLSVSLIAVK